MLACATRYSMGNVYHYVCEQNNRLYYAQLELSSHCIMKLMKHNVVLQDYSERLYTFRWGNGAFNIRMCHPKCSVTLLASENHQHTQSSLSPVKASRCHQVEWQWCKTGHICDILTTTSNFLHKGHPVENLKKKSCHRNWIDVGPSYGMVLSRWMQHHAIVVLTELWDNAFTAISNEGWWWLVTCLPLSHGQVLS